MTVAREREGERTRPPRFTDDGGAVLAEAALITPIFIFLLFGILEFGGAFRDYLTLSNTVTSATRQEAIWGSAVQADWMTLQAIRSSSGAMSLDQINYVVVWKAEGQTDKVPAECKNASSFNGGTSESPVVGSCNRYTVADIRDVTGGPGWTCLAADNDPIRYYCPTARKVSVFESPDYLGVYISIRHPWVTGLFGRQIDMSDQSVTKLEPQRLVP